MLSKAKAPDKDTKYLDIVKETIVCYMNEQRTVNNVQDNNNDLFTASLLFNTKEHERKVETPREVSVSKKHKLGGGGGGGG